MSSPAHSVLRPPTAPTARAGGPGTAGVAPLSAALVIECSREGLARARSFTRETLRAWSLDHCCDDTILVVTELAANAALHAAPRCAGAPPVRLGLVLAPAHLLLTVSDPDDRPPVYAPGTGSCLQEHGRGLHIVDALSEAWGWAPAPPVGKTVWARLSTRPST
ncbi:ATP-binding protein [Streptomyces sp. NPDC005931]|uniref:ATP-binding protein n=1 Tax=Streptomyces sp. NPDC005931 TaxID=3364737 RepID=UPI0036A52224